MKERKEYEKKFRELREEITLNKVTNTEGMDETLKERLRCREGEIENMSTKFKDHQEEIKRNAKMEGILE